MTDKKVYSVKELQEILGLSRSAIYSLLKKNEFRSFRIGSRYLISKASFDRWLDGDQDDPEVDEGEE